MVEGPGWASGEIVAGRLETCISAKSTEEAQMGGKESSHVSRRNAENLLSFEQPGTYRTD